MPLLATLATGVSFSSPLFRLGAGVFSAGDNMSEIYFGVLVFQNEQEAGPLEILNFNFTLLKYLEGGRRSFYFMLFHC